MRFCGPRVAVDVKLGGCRGRTRGGVKRRLARSLQLLGVVLVVALALLGAVDEVADGGGGLALRAGLVRPAELLEGCISRSEAGCGSRRFRTARTLRAVRIAVLRASSIALARFPCGGRLACKWRRCRDLVRGCGSRRFRTARTLRALRIAVLRASSIAPCGGRLVHTLSTHNASRAAGCGTGAKCAELFVVCDLGMRKGILVSARVADRRADTAPRPTAHTNNSRN